jgi:hypothetical protein
MRGTYTATYLGRVADTFARRRGASAIDIGAAFDLIVGTSTGGIIACALAAGVPLGEVVDLYRTTGPDIFRRRVPQSLVSVPGDIWVRPGLLRQGEQALRTALEEKLGSTTIMDVFRERGIALAIPAVEMSQHRSWVFKTPHLPTSNHRDDNYRLVDVCLATSAAPVFRSMAVIDHPDRKAGDAGYNVFVDGGLWANNPVLTGMIDALEMTEPGDEIQIFSLGTCPVPAGEQLSASSGARGLLEWRFGSAAAELSIDSQQFAFDNMARMLAKHVDRRCSVVRFPSDKIPAALIPHLGLDDTSPEAMQALINQARTDADMTNSCCANPDAEAAMICALFENAPLLPDRVTPDTHMI